MKRPIDRHASSKLPAGAMPLPTSQNLPYIRQGIAMHYYPVLNILGALSRTSVPEKYLAAFFVTHNAPSERCA